VGAGRDAFDGAHGENGENGTGTCGRGACRRYSLFYGPRLGRYVPFGAVWRLTV
jgi:hypothetical protein